MIANRDIASRQTVGLQVFRAIAFRTVSQVRFSAAVRYFGAYFKTDPATPWTAYLAFAFGRHAVLWAFAAFARLVGAAA
jgi:hypothetical protein